MLQSTMSNRHTSLYQRGDSSNQLPKHLLNINGGGSGKIPTANSIVAQVNNGNKITNLNKTEKQKDNDVTAHLPIESPPMICIR